MTVHFPLIAHYIQWHSPPLNSLVYFWSLLITTMPHHHHTHTFGFVLHMLELLFVLLPHDYLHLRMFRHSYLNVDMMLSARYFHFLFLCYSNCVTSIDLSSSSQTLFSVISHLKFLQKVILLQLDQSCSTLKNFSNV